jgi:hypothetical protein
MIALAFAVSLSILVFWVDTPASAAALFGATGVTVGGAIEYMRRLGRDIAQTNLLVILCGELDDTSVATVTNALVGKL